MSGGWQAERTALQRSRRRRLAWALGQIPISGRLDPVLLFLVLVGLGLVAGAGWLMSEAGAGLGLFDPPLMRTVRDDRLLVNLRDGLAEEPLTAATAHGPESALFLAQEDGRLHRYDTRTGLWSTARRFGPGSGLTGPVTELRAGCGGGAAGADPDECAAPETLWARGRDGGLLRRDGRGWRALIPETAFADRGGRLVTHADLTTAAVSGDARRLVVGTRAGDLGLFDVDRQAWVSLPLEAARLLPGTPVDHLRWWRDRFWIGSAAGLQRLRWEEDGAVLAPVAGIDRPVLDLEVDGGGSLLVLEETRCVNSAEGCRRLSRLREPEGVPDRLIDETALFPELDGAGLVMAGRQDGAIVVMGEAGVHRYDLAAHGWRRLDPRPVGIAHRRVQDGALFYAVGAAIRRVVGGAVDDTTWTLPDGRPVQLADGPDGAILALSEAGTIHALWRDGEVETVFDPGRTGLDAVGFDRAIASGDRVLMLGSGDALLHDIAGRTYRRIPAHEIEPWLRNPETRFQVSGDRIYGLLPRGDRVDVAVFDFAAAAGGAGHPAVPGDGLPAPVTAVRDWNGAGISLIDGDGIARRIGVEADEAFTGPAAANLTLAGFRDVRADSGRLYAAAGAGLHVYALARRGWDVLLPPLADLGPIVQLAAGGSGPLGRTAGGDLVALDPLEPRIGGGSAIAMAQEEIGDVRRHGDSLFLAGAGRVLRYDMAARRVTDSWALGEEGEVRLVAVLGETPVSLFDERLWIGRRPVLGSDDPVHQAFVHQGHLWTVRRAAGGSGEAGSHLYLMGHPVGAPFSGSPICLFRQPRTAPEATRIVDATEILPGTLAVLTDAGLWFYSETARSWQRTVFADRPEEDLPSHETDRVFRLGNHLALVRGAAGARRIELVDISLIGSPGSCSTVPVRLPADRIAARAVAVHPESGTLAWLTADGTVRRWQRGETRIVLPPAGRGPRAGELRRLFLRADRLYATGENAVWQYDRARRSWVRHELVLNGRPLDLTDDVVLDAGAEGPVETVTATLPDAGVAVGTLDPGQTGPVALQRVAVPDIAPFGAGADALMDVQQRNGLWMFLLPDRLKALHPDGLVWAPDLIFPGPDESRQLGTIAGHLVVEADEGRTWWIGRPGGFQGFGDSFPAGRVFHHYRPRPEERTLLASDPDVGVVRLRSDGALLTCPLGGETLACDVHGGPHIRLDPASVRAAFAWRDRLALVTRDGLRLIDRDGHREVPVTGPAGDLSRVPDRAWAPAEGLWLLTGTRLARLGPGGHLEMLADQIADLRSDRWSRLWALAADGPRRWRRGRLMSVAESFGVDEASAIRGFGLQPGHNAWVRMAEGMLIYGGIEGPVRLDLPAGSGPVETVFALEGGGTLIRLADGRTLAGRSGGRPDPTDRSVPAPERPLRPLADSWGDLRRLVVESEEGHAVFDPITRLAVGDGTIGLYVQRPSGVESLAPDAGEGLVRGAPLDTSWLDWDREARRFVLRTTAGRARMAPEALIRDGHLIFGVPGRVLAERPDMLHHANRHGVWTFAAPRLDLDSADMLVRLIDLGEPVAMAHDAVLTAEGWLPPGRDQVIAGPAPRRVRLGDAVLEEDVRAQRVRGWIAGPGTAHVRPAFAPDGGFLWDVRRGLAFEDGRLVLETAAGGVPVDDLTLRPGPLAAPAETEPETLVDAVRWRWQRTGAGVGIALKDGAPGIALNRDDGLGFVDDRLRTAAAWGGRLMVLTDAALIEAPRAVELAGDRIVRHTPEPAGTRLEAFAGPDGVTWLYAFGPGGTRLWNAGAGRFEPVPAETDPRRRRLLAETGRLRIDLVEGRVETALRMTGAGTGAPRLRPITIEGGRFPFDRVTSVAATPAHVFVGSPAGLQVYERGTGFDLESLVRLTDLPPGPGGLPDPADARLGVAEGLGHALRIDLPGQCLTTEDGAAFRPCPDALTVASLARGGGPLWRWHLDPAGGPVGRYLDREGRPFGPPIRLEEGRFPHDRLSDFVACGDRSAAIWQDGRLSAHPGPRLSLQRGMAILDPAASRPEAVLCVREPLAGPDGQLAAGLFVSFADGSLARLDGDELAPVAAEDAALLRPRSNDRLVFERGRLRLLAAGSAPGLRFQHRGDDGRWHDLRWRGDRLAIDLPDAIAYGHGRVWLATADGLAALRLERGAGLRLDPDTMRLVALPGDGDCRPSDLRIAGPDEAILRCNGASDAVFRVSLTADGSAERLETDPFAETELIAAQGESGWRWTLEDRRDGRPGRIAIAQKGEAVGLINGRFDFDGPDGLAVPDGGDIHFVTTAGAWVRAAGGDFAVASLYRQRAAGGPATVDRLTVARRDGERQLCVEGATGEAMLFDAEAAAGAGRLQGCPDYLGSDGLWAYARDPSGVLRVTAQGRAGRLAERRLVAGRFSDGVAIGPPVPYRPVDGRLEALVPTPAGVLAFGPGDRPAGLYAPPFPGMDGEAVPRALTVLPDEGAVYLANDGLRSLDRARPVACPGLAALAASLPPGTTFTELSRTSDGRLAVHWLRPGGGAADWALAGCPAGSEPDFRTIRLDVREWRRFVANRAAWGDPPAGLAVSLDPRRVTVRSAGGAVAVEVPGSGPLLAALAVGRTLYLVTPVDIHALALPTALAESFAEAPDPP